MLDGMACFSDAERCGGDWHVHCPAHAADAPWVQEILAIWHWVRRGRNLTDVVRNAAAWVFDACQVLDDEWAGLDLEIRKHANDPAGSAAGA